MLFLSNNFLSRYQEGEVFSDKHQKLAEFRQEALICNRCPLRQTCQQVVFGEGNPESPVMFVGEGPGGDEDQKGRPFVGKAGQLLDKILKAVQMEREKIYISNIVKCRPPSNRKPKVGEMKRCLRILAGEMLIVRPKILVLLGSTALQGTIEPGGSIVRQRGKWIEHTGIQIMPTFHPAALLRDESKKRDVWEDFQEIQRIYQNFT